jgi:hypothetical protein
MARKKSTEQDIQRDICRYLEKQGYLFWRFSPETYNAKLNIHIKHRFVPNGLSDLMVLHPGDTKLYPTPCLIALEVKKPGGKASAGQILMQRRFRLNNHVYEFVKSLQEVINLGL